MDFLVSSTMLMLRPTQITFTCSNSTIETVKKVWNMFKFNNKNTRTLSLTSFWCFIVNFWSYFTPFSCIFIVDFEQVNVSWVFLFWERVVNYLYPSMQTPALLWISNWNLGPLTKTSFKTLCSGLSSEIFVVLQNFNF